MSLDHAIPALGGHYPQPLRSHVPDPSSQAGASRLAFAPDFRVGDWLVQPSLDRISRDGVDVRLRPQVMNMLVCLARGRGRTVSREHILDDVWPDQSVADTSIARCVAELRKALGDRAQAPAVIETIPKRGYRLIAPVTFVPDTDNARPSTRAVIGTTPHGTGRAALPVAVGVTPSPLAETNTKVESAIETRPPAAESSPPVAAHNPVTAAVSVTGDHRRRAAGFVWLAGLVAAVAALVSPPASR